MTRALAVALFISAALNVRGWRCGRPKVVEVGTLGFLAGASVVDELFCRSTRPAG